MIVTILWGAMIVAGLASTLLIPLWIWFHPDRTADDVVDFLLPVDLERAERLLDPSVEYSLRVAVSSSEFRELQRRRTYLYLEFLRRMSHNAAILVQCANKEAQGGDEQVADLARAVQQEGVKVRGYAIFTSLKLRFWLLFGLALWYLSAAPSLSEAREMYGIRGLEAYGSLKTAAGSLFSRIRRDRFEELLQNL
jgi:hypothetical protein